VFVCEYTGVEVCTRMCVCVRERDRERVCMRVYKCRNVYANVCVCVCERERQCVCDYTSVEEFERMCACVCVRV